jgi:hypothetical protein
MAVPSGSDGFVARKSRTTGNGRTLVAMFLGEDLLAWLVLAIGGAMAVGSVLAIVRPPEQRREGDLEAAPIGRSVVFAVIGAIGAVWALASLISG